MNSHCFCLAHPTHQHCYPQTERLCVSTHLHKHIQRTQKSFPEPAGQTGPPRSVCTAGRVLGARFPPAPVTRAQHHAQRSSPQGRGAFVPFSNSHKGEEGCLLHTLMEVLLCQLYKSEPYG